MARQGQQVAAGVEGGFGVLKGILSMEVAVISVDLSVVSGASRAAEASQRCGQGGPGGGQRFSLVVETVSFVAATPLVGSEQRR